MKAKATIRLKFPSVKDLNTVLASLSPEVNKSGFGRSRAVLRRDGAFLVLEVEADDTVALRSTLNAYLRWVNSMMNVIEFLEYQ